MIARTTRIALEVAVGLLAGVALLLGIAFWRLTTGPVELDFLTPRIEAALSDPQTGVTVDVGSTDLSWSAAERTVDLHSRDVEVRGGEGGLAARLPDIVLRFSLRALVQGTLAPRSVEVEGARLRVIRTVDGGFAFGPWGEDTGRVSPTPPDRSPEMPSDAARVDAQPPAAVESDVSRLLPTVIEHLMSRPSADRPLSFLRRVSLVDSRVLVEDRRAGRFWQAPVADIVLERSERGLEGEMNFELALGGRPLTADARFLYDRARDWIEVGANFEDLQPGALATLAPQLGVFSESSMELSGSLSARFDLAGVTESLRLELAGGPGRLAIQGALESPLPVRGLELRLEFERARERISLETVELRFGTEGSPGPVLNARADITTGPQGLAGDLALDATVTARDVSAAELTRYWPLEAATGGRRWVGENIAGGLVDQAELDLVLTLPSDYTDARIERLEGNFTYHDLEIHYLRPMPPVTGASGRAGFDAAGLRFTVESGAVGALEVRPDSRIDILGLDSGDEHMAIDLEVAGPLQASLALLDHERLRLIRKLGIDPAETSGRSEATIAFRFPLLDKLTFDQIAITAKAQLENAAIRRFLFGLDAAEGDLALDLDNAGMTLRGPVRLGDVPLRIGWTERFEAEAKTPTEVEVEIPEIDARALRVLGLELAPELTGPLAALVRYTTDGEGGALVRAEADLSRTTMQIEPFRWAKPPGEEARVQFALALRDQKLLQLTSLEIDAGTLSARGSGRFDEAGHLAALSFGNLTILETQIRDVSVDLSGPGIAVAVGGGVLDLEPVLEIDESATETPGLSPDREPRDDRLFTPVAIEAANLESVYFAEDRWLENVRLDLQRRRNGWHRIGIEGRVPRSLWSTRAVGEAETGGGTRERTVRIDFGPDGQGGFGLTVDADDSGGLLRALDLMDTMQGGRLSITGTSDGPLPNHELRASVDVRRYVLVEAPVLAKLLTVASFTGVLDLMRGEGIRFDRFFGDFRLQDGILRTDLMRAYGAALGLTAQGRIDFEAEIANLEGTLVPAYTVNRVLGWIPLLGTILTGGEGEGLFAVTYDITGPLRDPEVNVNPLSALAPGFLRNIFQADGSEGGDERPSALPRRRDR